VIITYVGYLVFGPIIFLADLIFGVSVVISVIDALRLLSRGVDTTGRVAVLNPRLPGRSQQLMLEYGTPGGNFQIKGTSKRQVQFGDRMPVRYDPDRPAFATTLLRPWIRTFVGIPTVLALMAMSIGMITSADWYFRGIHTSLQFPVAGASGMGLFAVISGYGAAIQYAALWRWRRRVQVPGRALKFDEKSGILVSFESADGPEEFWEPPGSVDIGSSDEVTVYYDPDRPAASATLRDAYGVRTFAIGWTVILLFTGPLAIFSLTQL
jgi:hypothetical protein